MTAEDILSALEEKYEALCSASEFSAHGGKRRIDFWTLNPNGDNESIAYEIKVSRGDFLSDSREKQEFALSVSNRFFYVAPKGLLRKDEIPEWAGLMEFDGAEFRVKCRSPKRERGECSWWLMGSFIRNSTRVRRDTKAMREAYYLTSKSLEQTKQQLDQQAHERWRLVGLLTEHGIDAFTRKETA